MKTLTNLAGGLALLAVFTLTSCKKEQIELNTVPVNGMTVMLVPEGGGEAKSFTMSTPYTDEEGETYGEFKEEHITLRPNTTYNATVTFFSDKDGVHREQNESIKREEAYYTVRYQAGNLTESSMSTDVAITITDTKTDGSPLGFNTRFRTGNAGVNAVQIELFASKTQGKSSMAGTVYNSTYWINVKP